MLDNNFNSTTPWDEDHEKMDMGTFIAGFLMIVPAIVIVSIAFIHFVERFH